MELLCDHGDGQCYIDVVDTGIGIGEDQQEAIFQEFHQVKPKGGSKEGFGLGLAIVKRLADLLRHDIGVESELGKGSRFTVRLPLVEFPGDHASDEDDAHEPHPKGASGLVILIEDDVNVANAWGLLLEAEGYQVATAASATEARADSV